MKQFEVHSIIFMKMDHIGDMVLSTPVFRAVKERYPECSVGVLCSAKGALVLKNSPFIDDMYICNPDMFDREGANNSYTKMKDFWNIVRIREKQYDLCISLRGDLDNPAIQSMLGAKYNISFVVSKYQEGFDYSIPNPGNMHMAVKNFELLKLVDVKKPDRLETDIFPGREDEAWADMFLESQGVTAFDTLVGISPGGGWFLNWWPWEKYAQLGKMLAKYDKSIKLVLVGGKAEKEVIEKIKSNSACDFIDASGKTTLQQLSALYGRMRLVVCNDGGTMHIATTAKAPLVALFGPSPDWFYPVGNDNIIIHKKFACSPCPQFEAGKKPKCLNNKCMKAIEVKEVYRAVLDILNGNFRGRNYEKIN